MDWELIFSTEGTLVFDAKGRPLNLQGRTGLCGRGVLRRWGPNFVVHPIVTRDSPESAQLQVLAQRREGGEWSLPTELVDSAEETHAASLRGALLEEATELERAAEPMAVQ
eukprot:4464983-Prymnesium_polylepis.1